MVFVCVGFCHARLSGSWTASSLPKILNSAIAGHGSPPVLAIDSITILNLLYLTVAPSTPKRCSLTLLSVRLAVALATNFVQSVSVVFIP